MDAQELVTAFRQRADDVEQPYLFSDSAVLAWASEAEREACLRAKLIFDRTTPSVCVVPVVPAVESYLLSPLIIRVDSVFLDRVDQYPGYARKKLWNIDQSEAYPRSRFCSDYGNIPRGFADPGRVGSLTAYSIDGNTLQIYATPDTSYAATPALSYLRLEVYRLPREPMTALDDLPEIPLIHQDGLVDWMLYRAFSGKDAEELDDSRAANALALFTQRFGERPSASQVRTQAEGRRWQTPYGGIR